MSSNKHVIPDIIVARLPRYLRALSVLRKNGQTTNSKELGNFLGYSAAQIRKDLSQFGEFGKQGTGYDIDYLTEQINNILNLDKEWNMIMVGCGNIGHAILNYSGFSVNGFRVVAVCDTDPNLIGKRINGQITVENLDRIEEIIQENDIRIAMLTVPAGVAQETADRLVRCGINGILSYAPVILNLPEDVRVEYIDPVISLQHITYYL